MKNVHLIDFKIIEDKRGKLVALEENKNIPFIIRRIYYIYDTAENIRRGFHAHKELKQILICLSGSCKIFLTNGQEAENVELNAPSQGLFIGSMIWREMYDFSSDCVLLVLANDFYNEDDYIRGYDDFLEKVNLYDQKRREENHD